MDAIRDCAIKIEDRIKIDEYNKIVLRESVYKATNDVIHLFSEAMPNPVLIYQDGKIHYANEPFTALFDTDQLSKLLKNEVGLDSYLMESEGYISDLPTILSDKKNKKVSIKQKQGRKIYTIFTKEIEINGIHSIIVYFNDITLQEYQSIKISNYNKSLEALVYSNIYKTRLSAKNTGSAQTHEKSHESSSSERNAILTKKRDIITSAREYIEDIGFDTNDTIAELNDLIDELKYVIDELIDTQDTSHIQKIGDLFGSISNRISVLLEFEDLSFSISEISSLLKNNRFDKSKITKMSKYLDGFVFELENWKNSILLYKDAIDIHYLDASLFSSFLQLEMYLSGKTLEEREDDLVLF